MIETLTTSQAAHYLLQDDNASWSYAGAHAMIEYLEQHEEDSGAEPVEFDQVAIRCDFSEYASLQDWAAEYFDTEIDSEIDIDSEIREYINDHGVLIEFNGGIIVSSF